MLAALGRRVAAHPLITVLAWVAIVVGAGGAALGAFGNQALFDRLSSGEPQVHGEAQEGQDLLRDDGAGPTVNLLLAGVDPADQQVTSALQRTVQDLTAIDGVAEAAAPLDPAQAAPLVSEDGTAVLVTVTLEEGLADGPQDAALHQVRDRLAEVDDAIAGSTGRVGGVLDLVEEITHQVEVDLRLGEGVALPVSLLVMVVVFGGFVAAGLPVVGAVASIAGGLGALLVWSHAIDLDASVVNVVTVLGLGLCIDYGLLMVSRYREELREGGGDPASRADRTAALVTTLATAGRTVTFSAVTVAISLMGLLAFSADILRAVGAAAMSVVLIALLVALTLVPALIALAGPRLVRPGAANRVPGLRVLARRLGDVAPAEGRFSALARWVQAHAVGVFVGVVAVLLLLASPVLSMQLRTDGIKLLPESSTQRQFFTDLAEQFPAASSPDVTVVADAPPEQIAAYAEQVATLVGVESVDPPRPQGDLTVLGIRTEGDDPLSQQARDVVTELRADRPEFRTWVTGQAAGLVDFAGDLRDRAPLAIGAVVLATFLLLFAMTGSLLVPLKALAMNVVSLGASLGVLVWIFQDGHLEDLLGFTATGGIEAFVPALALAFGFGLAMDYEVFLLSRIVEQRRLGMPNDIAVERGLQRSGRIITSAALIIVIVFGGFVAGKLLVIKEVGVALAVAVAIDATLVRMLLVPATMTLLGEWNWWAPGPLRRLHERVGVREH